GSRELEQIVASADGLQKSADSIKDARHFSNVLFNVMRGGIFNNGYKIDSTDLQKFVADANKEIAARHREFFRALTRPSQSTLFHHRDRERPMSRCMGSALYGFVTAAAANTGDPQLERLCREYLPLTFSRRHGDPSRPWNRFAIASRNPDGSRV